MEVKYLVKLTRRRYIAFKISNTLSIPKKKLLTILEKNIKVACIEKRIDSRYFRIIQFDLKTGIGILRCDHKVVSELLSILGTSNNIFKIFDIKSISTSGTIKALKRKVVENCDD